MTCFEKDKKLINHFLPELKDKELINHLTQEEKDALLIYYKKRDFNGNVYHDHKLNNTYSLRELIFLAGSGLYDEKTVKGLLECGFTLTKNGQSRSLEKYNIHSNILTLSKKLATTYSKDNNNEKCFRIKRQKTTEDLLNAKSGLSLCYPQSYLGLVQEFLKKNPLNKWHINLMDYEFNYLIESDKWKCKICDRIVLRKTRECHFNKCLENIINN